MSVSATIAVDQFSIPSATSPPLDPLAGASFEERWAVWQERGRENDLSSARTMRFALIGLAVIGALGAVIYGLGAGTR